MIKLQAFIDYLKDKGWEPCEYDNPRLLVFIRNADGEPQIISLAASESYSDYDSRIDQALDRLALCEGISKEQAELKVTGEYLISVQEVISLIVSKIGENDSLQDIIQMAKHDVLEEILNEIDETNKHMLKENNCE